MSVVKQTPSSQPSPSQSTQNVASQNQDEAPTSEPLFSYQSTQNFNEQNFYLAPILYSYFWGCQSQKPTFDERVTSSAKDFDPSKGYLNRFNSYSIDSNTGKIAGHLEQSAYFGNYSFIDDIYLYPEPNLRAEPQVDHGTLAVAATINGHHFTAGDIVWFSPDGNLISAHANAPFLFSFQFQGQTINLRLVETPLQIQFYPLSQSKAPPVQPNPMQNITNAPATSQVMSVWLPDGLTLKGYYFLENTELSFNESGTLQSGTILDSADKKVYFVEFDERGDMIYRREKSSTIRYQSNTVFTNSLNAKAISIEGEGDNPDLLPTSGDTALPEIILPLNSPK